MKLFDCTFSSPAANLATDEVLVDLCEDEGLEVLRFWESPVPFVVLGYGNKIAAEVNVGACEARNVSILRRCSGGGTVVQGPGCLNYAVTLRVRKSPALGTVTGTNRFVMERTRTALGRLLDEKISIEGCTDLALHRDGALLKFSGNAQRRRRDSILFHGTILYAFDLPLISELLKAPSKQPEYRAARDHNAFITNLPATAGQLKQALAAEWRAGGKIDPPQHAIEHLARARYDTVQWNADR